MPKPDFIEVETPVLQSIYGGAEARPFLTKLNALDQEMFMRISLEISLKKLIVGGMNRVFEMGKVFRNEGIDRNHNPEFTLLEAYAAYWDYNDMMHFVENLFEQAGPQALRQHQSARASIPIQATTIEIDMKAPWKRLTMKGSLKELRRHRCRYLQRPRDARQAAKKAATSILKKLQALSRGLLIAALFEVYVEPHLIQPHHIIDHPIETTPLCKLASQSKRARTWPRRTL